MSIKAFDLVPTIERIHVTSDKSNAQILCLECCGKNLYLGTDDCFVIHYLIEEHTGQNGKVIFTNEKQGHKFLGVKKPVIQLKAASAINRVMVLCDATLSFLNMLNLEPILTGSKVKGVAAFSLNSNPIKSNPFSVEICVATKKKSVQIYTIREDHLTAVRDIPVTDTLLNIKMDGMYACVALASEYKIINTDNGHIQDLFPFESEHVAPLVTQISRDEYLLNASNALGVFALVKGISQRPPLQWTNNVISVAYVHPYILALNDEFITIHSILDQQQKQTIPFVGGRCMGEFDGRIFVSTSRDVYSLISIPVEKQIQSLLADRRVSEALELAKNARKTGLSKENFNKMFRRIQQQAGFIEYARLNFDEAHGLFKNGQLDARELITLYPSLMPANTSFTRSTPLLHDFADVNQLARGDLVKLQQFKDFLLMYLKEVRETTEQENCLPEIDTAILKLYAELNSDDLIPFIMSSASCDVADCIPWLERCQRHNAVALLQSFHGEKDMALDIWIRICNGELQDNSFQGFEFVVDYLSNLTDAGLVWKYANWAMEKDEILAVKIFTNQSDDLCDKLGPDIVVDFLARFPKAIILYLEHLVYTKKLEKEKYHTHLAVLYLDHVLQMLKNPNTTDQTEFDSARARLRQLLQYSNLYRVQLILGKVRETEMHWECAILYGKLEEHEKALRILAQKLRNFSAAENYCFVNSEGREPSYRNHLFQTLLSIYLDPKNERRDSFVTPAVSLLNNNLAEFDSVKVLQMISDSWSVGLLNQFLASSVRKSLNQCHTTRIERMLARGENLIVTKEAFQVMKEPLIMTEDRLCSVCNRGFSDPVFLRYPNNLVAHVHCGQNKRFCEMTGRVIATTDLDRK